MATGMSTASPLPPDVRDVPEHIHSPDDPDIPSEVVAMRLSTSREALLTQLGTVTRAVSTRSAIQALSGVKVEAAGGRVELLATDMELGLRVPLEAEVEQEGSLVLPGRLTLDVVRALPAAEVTIAFRPAEQDVEITSGTARFRIRTLRGEDFPELPAPAEAASVSLPSSAFIATVGQVARSASRDETRP